MKRLSEERTKILFEKLAKYIGPNIKLLIERPDEKILKLANTIPPEQLISVGTCFGKFTKSNKFRLHVTALNYIAPYAQQKQQFLYGHHVAKSGLGLISENAEQYQGVVVYSMSDLPLVLE
ncbi:hypothetical protein NQ314_013427 [Rhamnusium bicolor]|uniref:Uncharacterized protein n=1 Tax=Rhamnusium bicolor TaxID=1586634 RepID=A0AAV8X6Q3_9CUCU|nr:hypothetical protein NQ314_013427 [Rhamnusium bicolor]